MQRKIWKGKTFTFLKKKYQIDINPRTLGRIMNKLGLLRKIRRNKRKREIKNVNTTFKNLANRYYDGQMNDIYVTDVTYIHPLML